MPDVTHFVRRDFAREIRNHPHSRVWVLSFPWTSTEKEAIDALASYELRKRVDARNIFAQLYVGDVPGTAVSGKQQEVSSKDMGMSGGWKIPEQTAN